MEDRLIQYQLLLYKLPFPCNQVTMRDVIGTYASLLSLKDGVPPEKKEIFQKKIEEYEQLVERMFLRRLGRDITDLF